jgi:hypothetical protein
MRWRSPMSTSPASPQSRCNCVGRITERCALPPNASPYLVHGPRRQLSAQEKYRNRGGDWGKDLKAGPNLEQSLAAALDQAHHPRHGELSLGERVSEHPPLLAERNGGLHRPVPVWGSENGVQETRAIPLIVELTLSVTIDLFCRRETTSAMDGGPRPRVRRTPRDRESTSYLPAQTEEDVQRLQPWLTQLRVENEMLRRNIDWGDYQRLMGTMGSVRSHQSSLERMLLSIDSGFQRLHRCHDHPSAVDVADSAEPDLRTLDEMDPMEAPPKTAAFRARVTPPPLDRVRQRPAVSPIVVTTTKVGSPGQGIKASPVAVPRIVIDVRSVGESNRGIRYESLVPPSAVTEEPSPYVLPVVEPEVIPEPVAAVESKKRVSWVDTSAEWGGQDSAGASDGYSAGYRVTEPVVSNQASDSPQPALPASPSPAAATSSPLSASATTATESTSAAAAMATTSTVTTTTDSVSAVPIVDTVADSSVANGTGLDSGHGLLARGSSSPTVGDATANTTPACSSDTDEHGLLPARARVTIAENKRLEEQAAAKGSAWVAPSEPIRTKTVRLTSSELWQLFLPPLVALGVLNRSVRSARQARHRAMLRGLGLLHWLPKQQQKHQRSTKLFALGCIARVPLLRLASSTGPKLFAAGALFMWGRWARVVAAQQQAREAKRKAQEARQKAKELEKAAANRRYVRWQSIADSQISSGSMWATDGASEGVSVSALEATEAAIVEEFTIVKEDRGASEGSSAKQSKGPKVVSVLDANDCKQAELVLSMLIRRLPLSEMREAIESMNDEALGGAEVALRLLRAEACYVPRNVARAKAEKLLEDQKRSVADEYMLEVVDQVPFVQLRLKYMCFQEVFTELFERATANVGTLRSCIEELRSSDKYRTLLTQVVLPLGNKLRGVQTRAFRITDLAKLHATKNSQGTTFLEVVVRFCVSNCPLLVDLDEEFGTIIATPASKLHLHDAKAAVRDAEAELRPVMSLLDKAPECNFSPEAMRAIDDAAREAKEQLDALKDSVTMAEQEFKGLCSYLAETSEDITPPVIFGAIKSFLADLRQATSKELRRQQALARQNKKLAEQQAKQQTAAQQESADDDGDEDNEETEILQDFSDTSRTEDVDSDSSPNHDNVGEPPMVMRTPPPARAAMALGRAASAGPSHGTPALNARQRRATMLVSQASLTGSPLRAVKSSTCPSPDSIRLSKRALTLASRGKTVAFAGDDGEGITPDVAASLDKALRRFMDKRLSTTTGRSSSPPPGAASEKLAPSAIRRRRATLAV